MNSFCYDDTLVPGSVRVDYWYQVVTVFVGIVLNDYVYVPPTSAYIREHM